jgi:hypothetical protein
MACGVGINPPAAGFTYEPRHSIEHARFGLEVHTRSADKITSESAASTSP